VKIAVHFCTINRAILSKFLISDYSANFYEFIDTKVVEFGAILCEIQAENSDEHINIRLNLTPSVIIKKIKNGKNHLFMNEFFLTEHICMYILHKSHFGPKRRFKVDILQVKLARVISGLGFFAHNSCPSILGLGP
jgi:hypothetical protein